MTKDEARAALHKAIVDYATADDNPPGAAELFLDQWLIVTYWTPHVNDGTSDYATHLSAELPTHIIYGLIEMAHALEHADDG